MSRFGINLVAQRGAIAAYETKERWMPSMLEADRAARRDDRALREQIPGLELLVQPLRANYLAIDVSACGVHTDDIVDGMLREGLLIRSGACAAGASRTGLSA
ncbi:MAG: hypothetical protein U5K43_10080 [Halofilum sp. (in: g-proteobacteria)]|nr:hypothetical protein [Halofilum sp. (in: g-proteobacteria)]